MITGTEPIKYKYLVITKYFYLAASQTPTNGRLSRKTSHSWSPEVKKLFYFFSDGNEIYTVVFAFHIPVP